MLLNTGVTAFVGPNGSGKSNIFDALRWVFGEQSMKALRCEKIEDLIYMSSDTKEDANFTEVAITINNEDYFPQFGSEFEIKRRFYRTGESEFFLNRVKCRLQDIQALFLNSGALTYSFLELAEVERIIHGNTKEMFDDVAGILKYQERKEQTKRRLVATEQDLLRLEDIIAEMQRGLRSLKRQVRQAHLYNELRGDYKNIKLYIMANELQTTLNNINDIQGEIDGQESKRQVMLYAIKQLEEERESLKRALENAETEKKDKLMQITGIVDAIDTLQSQIEEKEEEVRSKTILSERVMTSIKEKDEVVNNSRKRLREAETERDEITTRLGSVQEQMSRMQKEIDDMNRDYFSLEKSLRDNEKKLSEDAASMLEEQSNVAKLNYDRENKESVMTRMTQELSEQKDGLEEYGRRRKALEKELETIVREQDDADAKLKTLHDKIDELEQVLNETEMNLNERNEAMNDCRIMIDTLKRRLQVDGKKAIQDRLGHKVMGMLKDCIEVAKGREAVIDLCLGDLLSFYLLKDYSAEDLMNCPEGRFGFIDMDEGVNEPAKIELPGVTPIVDYIKFKSSGDLLMRYVQNYFVVGGEAEAKRLSRQHPGCGFVTCNGVLFRKGTMVVERGDVGFFKITQSLEQYKTRIESLKNELLFITEEKGRLNDELEQTRQRMEESRNELFAVNIRKSECSLRLNDVRKEYEKRHSELSNTKKDSEALTAKIEVIVRDIEDGQHAIQEFEHKRAEITDKNHQLSERMQQIKADIDASVSRLNDIVTEKAVLEGKREGVLRIIERINGEISTAEQDIRALRAQTMPGNIVELNAAVAALKEELGRKRQERAAYESQLPDQLLDEYNKRQGLVYDQLAQKQKDHEALQDQIMQLKYRLFEKNHKRDDLRRKADEEFGINLADYTPEEELPDAADRLTEVKGRIEKLGEVNPLSLQVYEEEKKRLDEFLGQRDDIIAAKKNLMRSIEELDQRARDRFNEVFAHVRKEFNYVFANFFEDGEADLILTDPDNPLASKVEIVVRMMGRKLKTINQLSGGQKTLLAISLLLAFYLVKPAPFCILDEIDAPLDDINVVRFNKFLRDLSQRTQVVIITHNRATMEYADYLYGLTMEKPRESKVISARLADLEKISSLEE